MNRPRIGEQADNVLDLRLTTELAVAMRPIELSPGHRDRMRQRMLRQARDNAPAGTATIRGSDAKWIGLTPLIDVRELLRDRRAGTHVSLFRMQAGAVLPSHRHKKDEMFLILQGECCVGTHLLRPGDIHSATKGSEHGAITTQAGVLVLVSGEFPYPVC